ncbi:MAG TPA: hypothetical protein VHW44_18355 [Pseudonocardiaceae bacterium]|nr:hypothetical protein [Pseudonocardiaceae bacterium]
MADSPATDLPVGDLQLYDNYLPALSPGTWRIEVSHTLAGVDTGSLGATQEFVVSAPQFALDPAVVLSQYPPAGSTGSFAQVLPHIVLTDPLLPWERQLTGAAQAQPWLALLVLRDDELVGGTDSPTRVQTAAVGDFRAPDSVVLKPAVTKEDDVADTDPCGFVELPTAVFTAVTPRLAELRFLSHCRQVNIADKAEQGLDANGLFSVVVGNRFPAAGTSGPQKYVAHLVSLEGLESVLVDQPDFGTHTSVALISLASWIFNSAPDQQQDFRGLVEGLVGQEFDGTSYHPTELWLRLPTPTPPIDTTSPAGAEASQRLLDGFVPMSYQVRTGEQTFAWYRGPLTPLLTPPLDRPGPFLTADSALIYSDGFGVLDASLAVAWGAGRALALADRGFGQSLFVFRQRGHQLTDALLERLTSDAFNATQIAQLSTDTTVQTDFLTMLSADLLQQIGGPTVPPAPSARPAVAASTDPDPQTAVRDFVADPDVRAQIADLVQAELTPVASWLARLLLLYPAPFNLLVPDSRMLAPETLRFFYLDQNWLHALVDGALSVGMASSRDTFFQQTMHDLVHDSALAAAQALRDQLVGVSPPAAEVAENLVSGFLLRSDVVAGWPNLAVRGLLADDTLLKVLRLDRLAPDLLLCLFWGVPDHVELSEPQEGFRFGVDDDGQLPLRQPTAGAATTLGTQLGTPTAPTTYQLLPAALRSADSGVLDLAPDSATGAVQRISAALAAAGAPVPNFGPGDFALQLVKSPEAIRFTAQSD